MKRIVLRGGLLSRVPHCSVLVNYAKSDNLIFMKTVSISVTEAARNFAECVNRTRYQGTTFVLLKNGKAVARMIPDTPKIKKGKELASALREALKNAHLTSNEAKAWLYDLEEGRRGDRPPGSRWPS